MKYTLVVMILLVLNKPLAENTWIGDCSVQGDSHGVSKTNNKKVVSETPQKADARDYEKTR